MPTQYRTCVSMSTDPPPALTPIQKSEGVTPAERYLERLCTRSFLSLWSYPRVFRDQGRSSDGTAKEVCDLVVVFGEHIIIFSDKHVAFGDTGDLQRDWDRWFRRAVSQSAKQIWGADRWIREHPDRLFLDPDCTQQFPLELPGRHAARVHRIVVAHGVSARIRRQFGGTGTLVIAPSLVGVGSHRLPFTIGQLDPGRGFVHVLDDASLEVLLGTLDTVSDFTSYLAKKEAFIRSGRLTLAAGEDDMLGYYLRYVNKQGEHDFVIPERAMGITIGEGFWESFAGSPERARQIRDDRVSYLWDSLIDRCSEEVLAGTSFFSSAGSVSQTERAIRVLASEPRLHRRMLSEALLDQLRRCPPGNRAIRRLFFGPPDSRCYILLVYPRSPGSSDEEYRGQRAATLYACCMVGRLKHPHCEKIMGIAWEPGTEKRRSHDIVYVDGRSWTADDQAEALELQKQFDVLTGREMYRVHDDEYRPNNQTARGPRIAPVKGRDRNSSCPCGSGRKYKRCCGH